MIWYNAIIIITYYVTRKDVSLQRNVYKSFSLSIAFWMQDRRRRRRREVYKSMAITVQLNCAYNLCNIYIVYNA